MTSTSATSSPTPTSLASLQRSQAASADSLSLEQEATQDALWRMAQNNAMAKLRGFNTLAKAANDMA